MKLRFEYSIDSEVKRVIYTLSKRQFYVDNGYKVSVPKGINTTYLDKGKEIELRKAVVKELKEGKVKEYEKKLSDGWTKFGPSIESFLDSLPYIRPTELCIVFTQYGTGGSYGPPNKIICNIHSIRNIFETSVHELIHCVIEEPVVNKFKLTHWEKESLVEYLIIENLNDIFPEYVYRNDNRPSKKLLKKVGWLKD